MITESKGKNIAQAFRELYMIVCDYKAEDLLDILCPRRAVLTFSKSVNPYTGK